MQPLRPALQTQVYLQFGLPKIQELSKQVQNAETNTLAVRVLKDFGDALQNGPTKIHVQIGTEETEKEKLEIGHHSPNKGKEEEVPLHISSLPTEVTATIASYLSIQDQKALATAAAVSKQTENVTDGIAMTQLSFLERVSVHLSASKESGDEFYTMTGQHFPEIETISKMRQEREQSKLGKIDSKRAKQIDQEISKLLALLKDTIQRGLDVLKVFYTDFDTAIDPRNPSEIQEFFSILHAHNLVRVGEYLGIVPPNSIRTKAQLLDARRKVGKELAERAALWYLGLPCELMTSIPLELTRLKNLIQLNVRLNRISEVPDEIGNLTTLRHLDLGVNYISVLPESIGNLTQLTALHIGGNRLSSLPMGLGKLENLTTLTLQFNPLPAWPQQLESLPNLKEIMVSKDQLIAWAMDESDLREKLKGHGKFKMVLVVGRG